MTEQCCTALDPKPRQGKTAIDDKVFYPFYMSIGFGATKKRMKAKFDSIQASCTDGLCLSDHTAN